MKAKILFTPGPLNCSSTVKEAMLRDLGSRDLEFIDIVKSIRSNLLDIAGVTEKEFATILLQGSGTFSVEAAIQTIVPRAPESKVLLLVNGAYGRRMQAICEYLKVKCDVLDFEEDCSVNPDRVTMHLRSKVAQYCAVCVVHCETSSGIVNPVTQIGKIVRELQPTATFLVDAMSSFGAVPLDLEESGVDFLVSSANKCLQGVPGFAFVIARKSKLIECKGNARSLSLDLVEQHVGLEKDGQFRFTPPTHALLAFSQALKEYNEEGGLKARAARYKKNCSIVQEGMKTLGFKKLLPENNAKDVGYIITSFRFPSHPNFCFEEFYKRLSDMGQVIYPGKVTRAECFRIGHIGDLGSDHMSELLECVHDVLEDMKIPIPCM